MMDACPVPALIVYFKDVGKGILGMVLGWILDIGYWECVVGTLHATSPWSPN